ncbi:hypothetical protein P3T76_008937 [Phytophthora citrophthora]|uniref:Uncharacterized protein n=1 Tax=Phytophthora citrophthora TaxID=4793 RepID=A0AAD9GI42_9STRA|nr:hypothetical protein P3T76_008937 [Phytophthora citrophthora]
MCQLMETKSPTEGLTTEHIKSHLQKYRISHERSRLEVQRHNDKRGLKRHRRHVQHREAAFEDSKPEPAPPSSLDQLASAAVSSSTQWNVCDALLQEEEGAEHMHSTMQQRMDFHRELLLTRSVEVVSGVSWANRMENMDINTNQETGESSFLQAWANAEQHRHQESQVYGRLHEQQQNLFQTQDAAPVAPFTVSGSQPEPPPATDESMDGGMDLSSWGRLSLTVDPDDDDVFGFLRGT